MAKSKIIKELANKEISLEVAFNRLLIIASDIENEELINWATNELNGYSNNSQIPTYRKSGLGQIIYSGINGNFQVKSQPLPNGALDKDIMEKLKNFTFSQDISSIEQFSLDNNDNGVGKDLTALAPIVYHNTEIQCISIYMKYTKETFIKILSAIRTKLLKVFIELDKNLGNLDDLDINTNEKKLKALNDKLNVIIYEDNSVTIGDSNKLKNSFFQKLRGKSNGN